MLKFIISTAIVLALSIGGSAWGTTTQQAYWINLDTVKFINCLMSDNHHAFGTAFVVAKDRVVTANHVIYGAKSCTINGKKVKLIHHSESLDMAVLDIDLGPNPATLPLSCEPFKPGETYYSLGFAKGADFAITKMKATKDHMNYVDEDAKIEAKGLVMLTGLMVRGMSGGPILDEDGRVVGINSVSNEDDSGASRAIVDTPLCDGLRLAAAEDEESLYPMPLDIPKVQITTDFLERLKHLPQPILPAPETPPGK